MSEESGRESLAVAAGDLKDPAIGAVLRAVATLVGMEVVFIGGLTRDTFTIREAAGRGLPSWPELSPGTPGSRRDSFCHAMLEGAPPATADVSSVPAYADIARRQVAGVRSYVGVPIVDDQGLLLGTLCGVDRDSVVVGEVALEVMQRLADVISARLSVAQGGESNGTGHDVGAVVGGTVIRRGPRGWEVGAESAEDLVSSLVLADLLDGAPIPAARPAPVRPGAGENERLRTAVSQLEHALANRVTVEQAIGALAQRDGVTPRQAFQRLRAEARRTGRRVHDLAHEVVVGLSPAGCDPSDQDPTAHTRIGPARRG